MDVTISGPGWKVGVIAVGGEGTKEKDPTTFQDGGNCKPSRAFRGVGMAGEPPA